MKNNKNLLAFVLLILTGAACRIFPMQPFGLMGFAPQLAMALFGGAIIRDKKWAFALPIFSMLLSDLVFEGLFRTGYVKTPGFYEGQGLNYLFLMAITFVGIAMRRITIPRIAGASIAAPVLFFLASNFATWAGHGGYNRPMTGSGLFQAYLDGVPFFYGSLAGTLFFSTVLFGVWYLMEAGSQRLSTSKA